ncbi:spermidine synthase [Streptomyces zingiberis]|uniref:spermidine synthase n=1 Tax=Streptomyces zingiberis TaxID=2053010 RepID=UPI0028929BD9|nr:fused MFS/spermidine synthase [Streptomyces zingiberis]
MEEPIPVSRAVDGGLAKLMPDVDRERAYLLTLDGAPQSYVDLDAPEHLEFEYARRVAHVLHAAVGDPPAGGPGPDVLHLGGGALTLPRHVAATRPGSRQAVVDTDGELLRFVTEVLPLPPDSGITLHVADARAWLESAPAAGHDLLIADVFGGTRMPPHLTTAEYARAAARVLRPGGVYVANVADGPPLDFLRSQLATLGSVFEHLCLIAEPAVLRGRRFANSLVVASGRELPVEELARRCAADPFPARVAHGDALARLVAGAAVVHDGQTAPPPVPPPGAFEV